LRSWGRKIHHPSRIGFSYCNEQRTASQVVGCPLITMRPNSSKTWYGIGTTMPGFLGRAVTFRSTADDSCATKPSLKLPNATLSLHIPMYMPSPARVVPWSVQEGVGRSRRYSMCISQLNNIRCIWPLTGTEREMP